MGAAEKPRRGGRRNWRVPNCVACWAACGRRACMQLYSRHRARARLTARCSPRRGPVRDGDGRPGASCGGGIVLPARDIPAERRLEAARRRGRRRQVRGRGAGARFARMRVGAGCLWHPRWGGADHRADMPRVWRDGREQRRPKRDESWGDKGRGQSAVQKGLEGGQAPQSAGPGRRSAAIARRRRSRGLTHSLSHPLLLSPPRPALPLPLPPAPRCLRPPSLSPRTQHTPDVSTPHPSCPAAAAHARTGGRLPEGSRPVPRNRQRHPYCPSSTSRARCGPGPSRCRCQPECHRSGRTATVGRVAGRGGGWGGRGGAGADSERAAVQYAGQGSARGGGGGEEFRAQQPRGAGGV